MKEIKDKKIYKTATMVGSGFTYVEAFNLVQRWENAYGDRILCGEKVKDEVLERLRYDADQFYSETGFPKDKVNIEFDGDDTIDFHATICVYENQKLRYRLIIETPYSVYVEDEEGGVE